MGTCGSPRRSLLLPFVLLSFVLSARASIAPYACDEADPGTTSYGFCNAELPIQDRVDDFISRLTLEEKVSQLGDVSPAIPRLGVPAYAWWSEALHGVSNSGRGIRFDGSIKGATSFPQVILTAASFNPSLWYRIGQAIGLEARAIYNAGQATGLTFWAPNINIFRDPRWGRGQETPGEDPVTTSKYSVSYVRGLQGEAFEGGASPGLQVSACCKHFTAYDLDNWKGNVRYTFNAQVTAQDLADTYQPPFESCVRDGHASGIMCSYNRVNGVPPCADKNLLTTVARGSWGFNGYVTSDCDAVSIIHDAQGYAATPEDAVADVLKAGLDVNCGTYLQNHTKSAVQQQKISELDVNRALHNLFSIRMRLGLFNGNSQNKKVLDAGSSQVCSQEHQDLALEAARDGIVLLKNDANILPLSKSRVTSLGVIGPNANNAFKLLGNYAGPPCKSVTAFLALQKVAKDVRYVPGCDTAACPSPSVSEAVQLARSVDYVVMFMGLDQTQEKEELDRVDLVLPGKQQDLIISAAKAAKKPIILVLICGGPVDVSFAKNDPTIGAILWAGYPGEAGGIAIADIIFGDHNPGGRLPMTWYPQEFTKVPMTDMRMRADRASGYPGRSYRFYNGNMVYKFGYGLSYSSHSYKFISVSTLYSNKTTGLLQDAKIEGTNSYDVKKMTSHACEKVKLSAIVRVQNDGKMAGKHSVLLFLKRATGQSESPLKQLIVFDAVHLNAGESTDMEFTLSPCKHFSRTELDGSKVLDIGSHTLAIGEEEYEVNFIV